VVVKLDTPVENETEEQADEEIERLEEELDNLNAVLQELKEKVGLHPLCAFEELVVTVIKRY